MTVYERLGELFLEKYMSSSELAGCLSAGIKNLRSGHYGYWRDIVFQEWERFGDRCDPVSAACYLEIHTSLFTGDIVMTEIKLGEAPHPDAETELNNRILGRLKDINCVRRNDTPAHLYTDNGRMYLDLRKSRKRKSLARFSGEFWGGHGVDHDGIVSWDGECEFTVFHRDGKNKHPIKIGGRTVELEVGYTKAYRTLHHLVIGRSVARWPYGSENLYILVVKNENLWRRTIPHSPRAVNRPGVVLPYQMGLFGATNGIASTD